MGTVSATSQASYRVDKTAPPSPGPHVQPRAEGLASEQEILGCSVQAPTAGRVEDGRVEPKRESGGGWVATGHSYTWQKLQVDLEGREICNK